MPKLLSDEELTELVVNIQNFRMSTLEAVDLINNQKQLFAESIIGEYEDVINVVQQYANNLRAEQRARNK